MTIDTTLDVSTGESSTEKVSQTSKDTSTETVKDETSKDGAGETADANGGEHKEGENDGGGDDINPTTGKPWTAEDWKTKFSDSSRGAQALLDEKKSLATAIEQSKAEIDRLTKEIDTIRKVAEGDNPEGLKLHDLQTTLAKNANELALLKEESLLDKFVGSNPLASDKKEALRSLARAMPEKSLTELWDSHLKAGAEAQAKVIKEKKDSQKKGAGDQGKGTSMRETAGETIGGLPLEEFNNLPVNKRREILVKEGKV